MSHIYRTYSKSPLFTSSTKLDTFYFVYFVLHIFITILIDSAIVIPKELQPSFQQAIIEFHVTSNKDFLLIDPPQWLKWFVWAELIFQLPVFFIGAVALWKRNTRVYPVFVVYGIEASVTTLMCILKINAHGSIYGLTDGEVYNLLGVYAPTFVIPFFLVLDIMTREWTSSTANVKKTN